MKDTAWMTLLALALTACSTPAATRFYSLASPATAHVTTSLTTVPLAIEVLPINVPERLKRPQLVVSTQGSAQLKILEQDRWSSSFNDELRDAMASGIASRLGATDVSRGGRVSGQAIYRIAIVLQQFEAIPGDKVNAHFAWTVTRLATSASAVGEGSIACQASISKAVGNSADEVAKGVRVSVEEVAQTISANINALNNRNNAECGSI